VGQVIVTTHAFDMTLFSEKEVINIKITAIQQEKTTLNMA
jgi:hypothetical protein